MILKYSIEKIYYDTFQEIKQQNQEVIKSRILGISGTIYLFFFKDSKRVPPIHMTSLNTIHTFLEARHELYDTRRMIRYVKCMKSDIGHQPQLWEWPVCNSRKPYLSKIRIILKPIFKRFISTSLVNLFFSIRTRHAVGRNGIIQTGPAHQCLFNAPANRNNICSPRKKLFTTSQVFTSIQTRLTLTQPLKALQQELDLLAR